MGRGSLSTRSVRSVLMSSWWPGSGGKQKTGALAILLFLTALSPCAGQATQATKPTTHKVAMRDGVRLATDVYLPGDGTGKYPVIVARTPYNKSGGSGV